MKLSRLLCLSLLLGICSGVGHAASFKYKRLGNPQDVRVRPEAGIAMMGGGSDLSEAFRWLCGKANGGDFLILRARGNDAYNPYVNGLCKVNSVATLVISSRKAAQQPRVAQIIRQSEAVFIAGGDQSRRAIVLHIHGRMVEEQNFRRSSLQINGGGLLLLHRLQHRQQLIQRKRRRIGGDCLADGDG